MNANQAFQAALGQLQVEMPKGTYDTWVRDAELVAYEDGAFVIGANNAYARDWLEGRLKSTIARMLTGMMNRTVEVRFVVWQPTETAGKATPVENGESPVFQDRTQEIATALEAFTKLVRWSGNQIALSVSQKIAEKPGIMYNPLILYGEPGVGKSVTLAAIAKVATAYGVNVLRASAEEFTNGFVEALRTKNMQEFREKYRRADMLLVDDFHFLQGKGKTLEEFLSTFNALYSEGKHIVLATNKPPQDMELEEALASRLKGGLLVEVEEPDFEARLGILQQLVDNQGLKIEPWVLEKTASTITHDIRSLIGVLNRIVATTGYMGKSLENGGLEKILGEFVSDLRERDPKTVIEAVAKEFGIPIGRLLSDRREYPLAIARQVAMYLLREHEGKSLNEIGSLLERDHTTVQHGVEKIEEELRAQNSPITKKVRALEKSLYGLVPVKA
ncbi:chromosomal replication initiator protein DnaA [candidate division WWE3 bacterium RIFCSPHIGHO2_01_FULL_42_13]|uniref:Chromosomal replication initiator protein DnaA n=1 Tax=candidate division WWE3 bacterium RIFCSPHIGHO2_01_FULL_42_13 TaxID=1802617 RepID=A0A1F4UQW3_UNCKA|nr:MAG: chromosomal replication initiator protein DnaA [candidate division WWE3 bacterium RIFCSPHIGHO2_01_FULL_42_13]